MIFKLSFLSEAGLGLKFVFFSMVESSDWNSDFEVIYDYYPILFVFSI